MQALPDIPAERRKDAAERYLANAAADFVPAEQAAMAQQVLAILDDENFAEIFAPGSRAEVPIVGRIRRDGADPIPVAGQVDRLAVTGDTVLIADYKTDRLMPNRLDEVATLRHPARALPRGAGRASFPEKPFARRCCSPMGRSSWKCPPRRWMRH